MKRLIIKKLIVVSQSENKSLEVPFEPGLNVIYGGNKTGKSSIIKSIFTSFGCECRRVEKEWKDLISYYILFFQYGEKEYCILRENKDFHLFENKDYSFKCVCSTSEYHIYSDALMKILEVNMPCVTKQGEEINITPPLLFRFQYIDQDEGWSKIGDSFSKIGYIKDWAQNTNKYICGYLDEEYYSLHAEIARLEMEKEALELELRHNENFVNQLKETFSIAESADNPEELERHLNELLEELDKERKKQIEMNESICECENEIFVNKHRLSLAEKTLENISKDISFAMNQTEEIICPTCGAHYNNGLIQQMDLSFDYAMNEQLITKLLKNLECGENELEELKKQYDEIRSHISELNCRIKEKKELIEISSFYRNEGKKELYDSCIVQLEKIVEALEKQAVKISAYKEKEDKLKSNKRRKGIREDIINCCREIAELIDIPKTFIKLRDFVQVIEKTGSETPRLVYMYQVALYNYNLNRRKSPFNFLVIDTPNQQGQDESNLGKIYDSFKNFISPEGQVILGTERETGFENSAGTVFKLTEKRRCLTEVNYKEHQKLLSLLLETARAWRHQHVEE